MSEGTSYESQDLQIGDSVSYNWDNLIYFVCWPFDIDNHGSVRNGIGQE